MKILKLLLIFLVLVGGLIVAFNWDTWFKSTPVVIEDEEFAEEDLIDVSDQCDLIRKAWAQEKGWNAQLYQNQRTDIDQSKSMGLFSRTGYETVHHCLFEEATNKACEGYNTALHEATFSDARLQTAYQGVQAIKKAEEQQNSPRIQNVEQLHKLYTQVSAFVKSKHAITPQFKAQTGTWTSFAAAQKSVLSQAQALRNNPLFKEIEHLPGFKTGLSEQTLQKATAAFRSSFYSTLARQITDHFQSADATEENLALFNKVYQQFSSESSSGSSLASELVAFRRRVNSN